MQRHIERKTSISVCSKPISYLSVYRNIDKNMHRCVHIHSIDSLKNPTIDFSVHTFFPLKINLLNLIDINYYLFYLPLFF